MVVNDGAVAVKFKMATPHEAVFDHRSTALHT